MDDPRLIRLIHCDGTVHTITAERVVADQMRLDFKAAATPQTYDVVYSAKADGSGGNATKLTVAWNRPASIALLIVEDLATPAGPKDYRIMPLFDAGFFVSGLACSAGQVSQMAGDMENEAAAPQEYQVAAGTNPVGGGGMSAKLLINYTCMSAIKFISVEGLPELP
jgi:hypothetical protein